MTTHTHTLNIFSHSSTIAPCLTVISLVVDSQTLCYIVHCSRTLRCC